MNHKPLMILLAEDDDGHATLIRRNLERAGLGAEVVRLRDGKEVLGYLRQEFGAESAQAAGPRRPILVLLDIRMPGMDGVEVLQQMKSDPKLKAVPVYMLTTTDNPAEVERCFDLGCNAYLTKPVSYDAFIRAIERLCGFLEVSQIPILPGSKHASA